MNLIYFIGTLIVAELMFLGFCLGAMVYVTDNKRYTIYSGIMLLLIIAFAITFAYLVALIYTI